MGQVRVAIVGEAPGTDEVLRGQPFMGGPGKMLDSWFKQIGQPGYRDEVLLTNVFRFKAPQNDMSHFFVKRRDAAKLKKEKGWEPKWGAFGSLGFVREDLEPEIGRLAKEIEQANPNVILALGGTALWALTGEWQVGTYRGTVVTARPEFGKRKVVATYHPAAVLRNYENKVVAIADTKKVWDESQRAEEVRDVRNIYIEPEVKDVVAFFETTAADIPVVVDIETAFDTITCIGFGQGERSIVVPFYDGRMPDGSYWPTFDSEVEVWKVIKRYLQDVNRRWMFQNCSYDLMWLAFKMGIKVRGRVDDTMHMHHALQPELPKSLGFLGSLYTNEKAWKNMVKHNRGNTKRDE